MDLRYFDTHCHLVHSTTAGFGYTETELAEIVTGLERERIGVLTLTTDAATIADLGHLPASELIWAGVGFHPNDYAQFNAPVLKQALLNERVIAIGEIGLDDYRVPPALSRAEGEAERRAVLEQQLEVFTAQLQLAKTRNLPVSVHLRGSTEVFALAERTLRQLAPLPPVNLHFFTGDTAMALRCVDLGCFFSFGGIIFRDESVRNILRALPLERLLSETDSPFLHPTDRGAKNTPLTIPTIVAEMERIRGETLQKQLVINSFNYLRYNR